MSHVSAAERRLKEAGLTIQNVTRLANGTGAQITCATGEIITVYDSGKIVPGGKNTNFTKGLFDPGTASPQSSPKVFVVYGHDSAAKAELDAMLRRWGLEPIIMDQIPYQGDTLIEALNKYSSNDIGYGVVLATPDDEGHRAGHPGEKKFRARQNVVLELGLLLGKLGRPKVAVLMKSSVDMERPSDIGGLIEFRFKDSVHEIRADLAKAMVNQGLPVDFKNL